MGLFHCVFLKKDKNKKADTWSFFIPRKRWKHKKAKTGKKPQWVRVTHCI